MKDIFIVKPTESQIARKIEKTLISVPDDAGILFVGAEVLQAPPNLPGPTYRIHIGCRHDRDPEVIGMLAQRLLNEFVNSDQLVVVTRRGIDKGAISS